MKLLKFLFIILTYALLSCSKSTTSKDPSSKKNKSTDSNSQLAKYDLDSKNPAVIKLPKELTEISGITMTPDGRLFAQQDENGIIYQADYANGIITKKFALGNPVIKDDFEDIAFANNKFYLLKSSGDIYEFDEGVDGEAVEFKIYKTELNHANDVEGLCFDAETNSLLLACKGASGTGDNEDKTIYSFSLDSMKLNKTPRFILSHDEIKKNFNPSGIEKNPFTGTYFIIAANGNEIIEISKEGKILGRNSLPADIHMQPEGITFSKDRNLLISNEGKSGKGYIVIYNYKE